MSPYPLLDPLTFLNVLPNPPQRPANKNYDPKYFDEFGYLKGERGAGIAMASWTKRPGPQNDEYDADLTIRVIATPSPSIAKEALVLEEEQDKILFTKLKSTDVTIVLTADEYRARRLEHSRLPPMYIVSTRYGNYVFRFVGRIVTDGYFEDGAQFLERLRALDAHITATLRNATQPGAPTDGPRAARSDRG